MQDENRRGSHRERKTARPKDDGFPNKTEHRLHHVVEIENLLKWLRTGFNAFTLLEAGERFAIKCRGALVLCTRPTRLRGQM